MIVIRRPDIMIGTFSGAFSAVRKLSLLTRNKAYHRCSSTGLRSRDFFMVRIILHPTLRHTDVAWKSAQLGTASS
jgi:hypothetical protein